MDGSIDVNNLSSDTSESLSQNSDLLSDMDSLGFISSGMKNIGQVNDLSSNDMDSVNQFMDGLSEFLDNNSF